MWTGSIIEAWEVRSDEPAEFLRYAAAGPACLAPRPSRRPNIALFISGGHSYFAPPVYGNRNVHRRHVFAAHYGDKNMNVYPIRAVRGRRFKYIRNLHPELRYTAHIDRAAADPHQTRNRISRPEHARQAETMRRELQAWMKAQGDQETVFGTPTLLASGARLL